MSELENPSATHSPRHINRPVLTAGPEARIDAAQPLFEAAWGANHTATRRTDLCGRPVTNRQSLWGRSAQEAAAAFALGPIN